MTDYQCQICGKSGGEHIELENRGILNHKLSTDGSLVEVDRKPQAKKRQEVMVVPGVDMALRALLVEKGILSHDDFDRAGAFGPVPGGDRGDRPSEAAGGSLRIAPAVSIHNGPGSDDPGDRNTEPEPPTS